MVGNTNTLTLSFFNWVKYRKISLTPPVYKPPRIYGPQICNRLNIPNISPTRIYGPPAEYKSTWKRRRSTS